MTPRYLLVPHLYNPMRLFALQKSNKRLFQNHNPKYHHKTLLQPIDIFVHLIAVLAFASIFLFTNRKLQMKVVLLNSLLSLLYMAFLAYGIFQHVGLSNYGFKIGAILPVFIFIFNVLAYAGIKSDENLVRSMDRLR